MNCKPRILVDTLKALKGLGESTILNLAEHMNVSRDTAYARINHYQCAGFLKRKKTIVGFVYNLTPQGEQKIIDADVLRDKPKPVLYAPRDKGHRRQLSSIFIYADICAATLLSV